MSDSNGPYDLQAAVFEQLPMMVSLVDGPELRFAAANAAYRAYIGRPGLIGRRAFEVIPEATGQRLRPLLEQVMASGRPVRLRDWRIRIVHPGTGEQSDAYLNGNLHPFRDAAGAVAGVIVDFTDVTDQVVERREARRRTAEAEQRFAQARDVIDALQRQLLPTGLPVLPAVELAAGYLLADADAAAGGDWFDALALPGGRVALIVGDVVGNGVAASAAMGQLRAVLQDRLDETGDVLTAIAAADRMAHRLPGTHAATVCAMVLDPADGTLTWCSAGHPPPLTTGPDGTRFLPRSGHGPLGTGAAYTAQTGALGPGELVLLYTDGIVERPGRTPAEARTELAEVVREATAGRGFDAGPGLSAAEQACAQTLELLVRLTGHSDDITLLAARRRALAAPLHLTGPSATTCTNAVRAAVQNWVASVHGGRDDAEALTHTAVELVANSCEHARFDHTDVTVTITCDLDDDGSAHLTVSDTGRWRERSAPGNDRVGRGQGLALARSLTDHLEVTPAAHPHHGTTVTARRRLSRSARMLAIDPGAVVAITPHSTTDPAHS